jgi:prepilin-type N-terminal cleavage/methylation domain-containing protein
MNMNRLRLRAEGGFTLIELLVVIAIIGILAAIAIPQFASYRNRGFQAQVWSDLRNAGTAQEAYFVDNNIYSDVLIGMTTRGYKQHPYINLTVVSANAATFILKAEHDNCTGDVWTFESKNSAVPITGGPCD